MSDTTFNFRFVTVIAFLATGFVAGCVDDDSGRRASTTERTTTTVSPAPTVVMPAPAPGTSTTTTTTTKQQTYP